MWKQLKGRYWVDTWVLWINASFWKARKWWYEKKHKKAEEIWKALMQNPKYHWTLWPFSLKGRYYRLAEGPWLDEGGLIWLRAFLRGDRFPASWLSRLRSGKVGIDIGAHRGYWTLTYSKNFPRDVEVFLLEPDQENYFHLLRNLALNQASYAIPLRMAAWEVPCRLSLKGTKMLTAHSSFSYYAVEDENGEILATSIDQLVETFKPSTVDWMKIDTEGAEVAVLRGALKTLQRFKPTIWMEIHDTKEAVSALLKESGYEVKDFILTTPNEGPYKEVGYLWAEPS
ncbi:MAG: FkbM family methyltransferase [Bacteroidia bacterium]|nr:FkbM family methyltransferase [Bacteroidia bacterium]MDW8134397.1 FkbM family methyltransferase [Bacteroidia bacterium]